MCFKPNLFILGAARCGTTFLYDCLQKMPEVCLSIPKEPPFFDYEYDRGLNFYRKRYFSHYKGENNIGEAHLVNLILPFVAEDIYKTNSAARLIIIVRDPAERAHSRWWWFYSRGLTDLNFPKAIRKNYEDIIAGIKCESREEYLKRYNPASHNPLSMFYMDINTYIQTGYYYEHIQRYRNYFPDTQIKVFLFKDLVNKPAELISQLRKFLGLSEPYTYKLDAIKKNPSKKYRTVTIKPVSGLTEVTKRLFSSKIYLCIKRQRPKMDRKTRKWLSAHYREHNKRLEEYIGRDLSHWC